MISRLWTLLVLPCFALAFINIHIRVGDTNQAFARAEGSFSTKLHNDDIYIWGIREARLKDAVETFTGFRPDNVYLDRPIKGSNGSYKMQDVRLNLKPVAARIIKIIREPATLHKEMHTYNTSTIYELIFPKEDLEQNVEGSWTGASQLSTILKKSLILFYRVDFKYPSVNREHKVWFEGYICDMYRSTSESIEIGSTFRVPAGSNLTVELFMTRATMEVEINYEATLSGDVACHFVTTPYKGYKYHSFPVNTILDAVKALTVRKFSQTIKIEFVLNVRIDIRDVTRSVLLYSGAAILSKEKYIDNYEFPTNPPRVGPIKWSNIRWLDDDDFND